MAIYSDDQIAIGLRRLNGQIATPFGFDKQLKSAIEERGLARFSEWPSGHWTLTERGRNFLASLVEEGGYAD